MSLERFGRRHFLALALGVSAASALLLLTNRWVAGRGSGRVPNTARTLARYFDDPAHARTVGREYLAAHPREAGLEQLTRLLLEGRPSLADALATPASSDWRGLVRVAHREDFAEGRVVNVRGWILSHSEARMFAIAALVPGGETLDDRAEGIR